MAEGILVARLPAYSLKTQCHDHGTNMSGNYNRAKDPAHPQPLPQAGGG